MVMSECSVSDNVLGKRVHVYIDKTYIKCDMQYLGAMAFSDVRRSLT